MANIALKSDGRVRAVDLPTTQMTLPAGAAITAGQAVGISSAGKFILAKGSASNAVDYYGIAVRTVPAGMPVTAVRQGAVEGFDVSGKSFGALVYLSAADAGTLVDTPPNTQDQTVQVVGFVVPGTATTLGTGYDKLLYLEPRDPSLVPGT